MREKVDLIIEKEVQTPKTPTPNIELKQETTPLYEREDIIFAYTKTPPTPIKRIDNIVIDTTEKGLKPVIPSVTDIENTQRVDVDANG